MLKTMIFSGSCGSGALILQCRSIRCNAPPVVRTRMVLISEMKGRGPMTGSRLNTDLSMSLLDIGQVYK